MGPKLRVLRLSLFRSAFRGLCLWDLGFAASGFGFKASGLALRGLGLRDLGLGFRIWGVLGLT